MSLIYKDPEADKWYFIDWKDWLGIDVIQSVEWTVPDGLEKEDENITDTAGYVKISGGVEGVTYTVRALMTTASSTEVDPRSFQLCIRRE